MRLTNQMREEAVITAVGKEALPIVEYLDCRRNISDFKIAEKTDLTVQKARNLLYQLHEHNIVKYIRRKDDKKGWYISYFTLNKKGIKNLIKKQKEQNLEKYKDRLEFETEEGVFFICPNFCSRLTLNEAAELNFHCAECGSLLNQQDNSKTIEFLKSTIEEIEVLV